MFIKFLAYVNYYFNNIIIMIVFCFVLSVTGCAWASLCADFVICL